MNPVFPFPCYTHYLWWQHCQLVQQWHYHQMMLQQQQQLQQKQTLQPMFVPTESFSLFERQPHEYLVNGPVLGEQEIARSKEQKYELDKLLEEVENTREKAQNDLEFAQQKRADRKKCRNKVHNDRRKEKKKQEKQPPRFRKFGSGWKKEGIFKNTENRW